MIPHNQAAEGRVVPVSPMDALAQERAQGTLLGRIDMGRRMEDMLFIAVMAVVVSGLVLMCAALIQIKRHGGFEQAMASASDGKWPIGRWLFGGALLCFGLAAFSLLIGSWFD